MNALTTDIVLAAGVAVVREHGWNALSMRAVAARLDVTPMALYRHVSSAEALSEAVLTAIAGPIAEVTRSGDAIADLEAWARRAYAALVPYPGAATALLVRWFETAPALRAVEGLLQSMYDDGVDGFEAVAAVNVVFMFALMRAQGEQSVRSAGVVRRRLRTAAVAESLPRLTGLMEHYTTARFDLHFEYGLQALLNGIAARSVPA
ncbi:MAG: TetR/AcrR family transcriptional regulator [Chloroflexi bacterium]|nr:TetR/AcrR family transcriptional regulator [Chloroflexota bacterium]MDA1240488.1 TetR/AcrR family transcriptional regulator [Chloroflexota bacterium]